MKAMITLGLFVLGAGLVAACDDDGPTGNGDGLVPASYINRDTGMATENPDVTVGSSCATPDQEDSQALSDAGTANRNVHNDACLLDGDEKADGAATFESSGVGFISACPDPDDAGSKTATNTDTNGDGQNDRCVQTGFQEKGVAGDEEFHARLNNSTTPGVQTVVFCQDEDLNGCADETVTETITITWTGSPGIASAASYINRDTGMASENPDVNMDSRCLTPDQADTQQLSDAGMTNRNVHNDACLFGAGAAPDTLDGTATFESSGVGFISACPDPDDAGPKTATNTDTNGDGQNDRCVQTGFQEKGTPGDREFHARLNNSTAAGTQTVVFCLDSNANGCADAVISDTITITWTP